MYVLFFCPLTIQYELFRDATYSGFSTNSRLYITYSLLLWEAEF